MFQSLSVYLFDTLLQVRDIITKNLSTEDLTLPEPGRSMSSGGSDHIREENRMLQAELNRVEDLLAASRAERDEIGIKYNALSERVSLFNLNTEMFQNSYAKNYFCVTLFGNLLN